MNVTRTRAGMGFSHLHGTCIIIGLCCAYLFIEVVFGEFGFSLENWRQPNKLGVFWGNIMKIANLGKMWCFLEDRCVKNWKLSQNTYINENQNNYFIIYCILPVEKTIGTLSCQFIVRHMNDGEAIAARVWISTLFKTYQFATTQLSCNNDNEGMPKGGVYSQEFPWSELTARPLCDGNRISVLIKNWTRVTGTLHQSICCTR